MEKRIIKYRAKELSSNEWVYGHPFSKIEDEFSTFHAMHTCDETGYWGVTRIRPETLSQYSGVQTFYEGDCLALMDSEGDERIGIVVFKEGMFAFELSDETVLPLGWAVALVSRTRCTGTIFDDVKEGMS